MSTTLVKEEFYVYLHKKADNGEVFYVGKGKGNRAYWEYNRNKYWKNVVRKHGYVVEILADGLCEESALEYECFKIKELREKGCVLVNLTNGGEGISGLRHSEETRKKMSEAQLGKKFSEETRRKMAEAKSGEKCYLFGRTGEKHHSSKPVLQFSKSGEFIKEWAGTREVGRVLKICHSDISKGCKGRLKSAGGYIWRFKEN